jgi:hypothetical protein
MAQVGFTPIQLYFSSTATNVPLAASLANGELAINITDGKLFYKDNASAVQVIGWKVVPATAGGTGQTSYAVGDLLYANTTTTLAKLADVATGNALISGGVGVAPSWGKIGLTTHVSGVLPVANGGTNASTASITSFNNITGYTASGATGTTSTNLVFSTSATLTTPKATTTIGVGNATAAASGAGITFPATQSDSSDPNTLDDYEEGTWTPTAKGDGGSANQTYSVQAGYYTKVGNQVTATFRIILTSTGTPSGSAIVGGLPFVVKNAVGTGNGSISNFVNLGTSLNFLTVFPLENQSFCYLYGTSAAAASMTNQGVNLWSNTTILIGSVTYFV